jgi:hypothetical protein
MTELPKALEEDEARRRPTPPPNFGNRPFL